MPHEHPDKLKLYEALVEEFPEIERKGKANPYTSMNGHMFSFFDKTGTLGIRLSEGDKAAFEAEHKTGDFIQHNSVMRGYVTIPAALLKDTKSLVPVFQKSIDYISSLEPKPTTKKKK